MIFSPQSDDKLSTGTLIRRLSEAEAIRDFRVMQLLFEAVWKISDVPFFGDRFDPEETAALYELAGKFLLEYGRARNQIGWQERCKDALGHAALGYEDRGRWEKAFECRMLIAIAYFYEGRVDEYHILLEHSEQFFANDRTHPIYLQIRINYSLYYLRLGETGRAQRLIMDLAELIENSTDLKVRVLYYTQAGILFRRPDDPAESIRYFGLAWSCAELLGNRYYLALIGNNLANTHRVSGNFSAALLHVDQALEKLAEDNGWQAFLMDTKANIYLDKGDLDKAFDWSIKAVERYRAGDDQAALAEGMWTLCIIYQLMDWREMALEIFIELYNLARAAGGELLAGQYSRKYLDITMALPEGQTFEKKVESYKRALLSAAMEKAGGRVTEAARILGFRKHQTLSQMLKQFPEIRATHKPMRKPRSDRRST